MAKYLKIILFIISVVFSSIIFWFLNIKAPLQNYINNIEKLEFYFIITISLTYLSLCFFYKKSKKNFKFKINWLFLLTTIFFILSYIHLKNIYIKFIIIIFILHSLATLFDLNSLKRVSEISIITFSSLYICIHLNYFFTSDKTIFLNFISYISYLIFKFLHFNVFIKNNIIFLNGKQIYCDYIKTGFSFYFMIIFPFIFLTLFLKEKYSIKIKIMIKLLIIFIFSTVFRTLFICYSLKSQQYVSFNIFRTFYFDKLLLFSLFIIPFLIWIFKNISLNFYELNTSYNIEPKKFIIILFVIMIFLFSILIFPFNKHQKPILIIDEIHSKWESTLIEYNMKITGTFAENSYYSFLNYLSHFYEIKILTNKKKHYKIPKNCFIKYTNSITSKTLEQYPKSILILKCSTKQYSKKEVNIIDNYMKKGNGVFLIGDHTNVMFMNSFLNEISEKYGIKYNYDSVYMTNGGWITLGKNELLNNPINLNISEFIWATNCSLSISKKAKTIMYSPLCCFSDKADYTNNYFFGSRKIESSEIFGRFPIVATVKVGKGKLAAFTDSTCFNNYLMFTASRREFINGIINYLSTEYGFNYNLIISILCVIILFFILKRSGFSNILFYLYLIIPLIIPFCFSFSNYINKLNYKIYKPIKKLPKTIGFDAVHKPVHCFSHGNSEDFLSSGSYDSLIFDIPRKDFFVDIFYKGKLTYNKLKKYYCYIISKPTVKYSNKEIYELKKYINNGGHILIFTGRSNYKNYEDQILNCFGFNIIDKKIIFSSNSALMNPIEIEGGENIYSLISNNTYNIVNYKKISKGSVLVISDDYLFTKISINYYSKKFKKLINKILISLNSIKKLKKINWNYYLTTDLKDISYYLKKMAEDKNKNSTKFNLN